MRYVVEQEGKTKGKGWPARYGPAPGPHPMAEDLVGHYVTLERGPRPTLAVLGVSGGDDVVCFCRIITGPAVKSTGWFPISDLGPSDYTPTLPHDRMRT